MEKCPICGSPDIQRSRATSVLERFRKRVSDARPHRCNTCGWRGWRPPAPLAERPSPAAEATRQADEVEEWQTSDHAEEPDLEALDLSLKWPSRSGEDAAPVPAPDPVPTETASSSSRRHRSHRGRRSRSGSTSGSRSRVARRGRAARNARRLQAFLIVALVLLGLVVLMRACTLGE